MSELSFFYVSLLSLLAVTGAALLAMLLWISLVVQNREEDGSPPETTRRRRRIILGFDLFVCGLVIAGFGVGGFRDIRFGSRTVPEERRTHSSESSKTADAIIWASIPAPRLSAPAGYYSEDFILEVFTDDAQSRIHFTVDGSTPSPRSPVYTGPIRVTDRSEEANRWRDVQNVVYDWKEKPVRTEPVAKAFVIRAVSVRPDGSMSRETIASYFVGSRFDADHAAVSIVADEDDLFGSDGIYVTGKAYDDWYMKDGTGERPVANFAVQGREIPAHFEFFTEDKAFSFAQCGGLRIQGSSTRKLQLKNLSLFSRKIYSGSNSFEKELFAGKATHSVALRKGFCNAFSMVTATDRDISVQLSIPVTVYLNGEFWYHTYMQEKYCETYFRQTYGVRDVEFLKQYGITNEIKKFLFTHDLARQDDYEAFGQMVDIQSYIDYICTNVYLANTDYDERYGNTAIWRTVRRENDGFGDRRWRWCLYDMDLQTEGCRRNYGMTDITDAQVDSFNTVCDWNTPVNERLIYTNLKRSETFRRQFVLSFMDMINTEFDEGRVYALMDEWKERIGHDESLMRDEWGGNSGFEPDFFRERPDNMIGFIAKEFGLENRTGTLTVATDDPQAGSVIVNTADVDLSSGHWSGRYFFEYPVTVTAVPAPGYRFKGWSGDCVSAGERIELPVRENLRIHARFERNQREARPAAPLR